MEIYKKIPLIMKKVGHIEKSKKNLAQGYMFRGIDDVMAAMQGLLSEHGVFFCPNVIAETREERATAKGGVLIYTILRVEFTFYADDGSSVKVTTVGEAMDSGDKSSNKSLSSALKYALTQLFCIPTEGDNDTENSSPEPEPKEKGKPDDFTNYKPDPKKLVSEAQVKRLYAIKAKSGMDDERFKAVVVSYGYDSSRKITMEHYQQICSEVQG